MPRKPRRLDRGRKMVECIVDASRASTRPTEAIAAVLGWGGLERVTLGAFDPLQHLAPRQMRRVLTVSFAAASRRSVVDVDDMRRGLDLATGGRRRPVEFLVPAGDGR